MAPSLGLFVVRDIFSAGHRKHLITALLLVWAHRCLLVGAPSRLFPDLSAASAFIRLRLISLFQFPESGYSVREEEGCGRRRFLSPADTEQPLQ